MKLRSESFCRCKCSVYELYSNGLNQFPVELMIFQIKCGISYMCFYTARFSTKPLNCLKAGLGALFNGRQDNFDRCQPCLKESSNAGQRDWNVVEKIS